MSKSKIRVTEKYLRSLGIEIPQDEITNLEDACVKRVHYDNNNDFILPHDADNYAQGTISSIDIDSDGDVILPEGVDLTRYTKNPIVLLNHSLASPIGYCESIQVTDERVIAKIRFGSTSEAQGVYRLVKDKVLRSFSIGFITKESIKRGQKGFAEVINRLKDKHSNRFNDETVKNINRVITKSLLVENSIVSIPANEHALISEIKKFKDIEQKEVVNELEQDNSNIEESVHSNASSNTSSTTTKELETEDNDSRTDECIGTVGATEEGIQSKDTEATEEKGIEGEVEKTEPEEPELRIRVVKRASIIKKVSSLEEKRQEKLRDLYLKMWGC